MQNILVTGGAGFIGSNFVRYLLQREPAARVVNLDALTYAGSLENLEDLPAPERHTFVRGDVCDGDRVFGLLQEYRIDTIVHFAAETHVDRSIRDSSAFIRTNVLGTYQVLEAARLYWLDEAPSTLGEARFHHNSTDEVFGSLAADDPPFTEQTRYAPTSPYSASKAASDHLVRAYAHTYGLPVTISHCSNNYGPSQFPEKLVPLVILNALNGQSLPIYGDGGQIRDWLYVEDHCEALWLILRQGRSGETYNVGSGTQITNIDLVRVICDMLDRRNPDSPNVPHRSLIMHAADRPGHDRRYAIDIRKIQRELGWQPRHALEDGIRETLAWYLGHRDWVEAIREQPTYQDWLRENYPALRAME